MIDENSREMPFFEIFSNNNFAGTFSIKNFQLLRKINVFVTRVMFMSQNRQ